MANGIAYGPVNSRRLGVSLGVNNIPAKNCTYSCVYCQIGRTTGYRWERGRFYGTKEVFTQVSERLREIRLAGGRVDYITFVPDGEPTLDDELGAEIERLKGLGVPIAVITNSSLLWRGDVRDDLALADLVSVKVDTVDEGLWRRINRPHHGIGLGIILKGIEDFAQGYRGTLISETMALGGVEQDFGGVAEFLWRLRGLKTAYISSVTRPPTEPWVSLAPWPTLRAAERVFAEKLGKERVAILPHHEGDLPSHADVEDAEGAVLGIVAVHPLREDVVRKYLEKAGLGWEVIDRLVKQGKIKVTEYEGKRYIKRNFGDQTG